MAEIKLDKELSKEDFDELKKSIFIESEHPLDSHEDEIPSLVTSKADIYKKCFEKEKEKKPGLIKRIKEEFEWRSMIKSAKKWSKEVLFAAVADTAIEMIDQIGGDFRTRILGSLGLKSFDKNLRKRSKEREDRRFGNASYKHYSRMSRDKSYDFDDIQFPDRKTAELVRDELMEQISVHGYVTVYDFLKNDKVDEIPERNDKNYGWDTLRKSDVCYDRRTDEYYIDLPDPIDLRD